MANYGNLRRMQTSSFVNAESLSRIKSRSPFKYGKKAAKECLDVTFDDQRAKDGLWESLMSHFTLPDHLTDADVEKIKNCALKKMAIAFNNHKKTIWAAYVEAGKHTPEFKGTLEKARDH